MASYLPPGNPVAARKQALATRPNPNVDPMAARKQALATNRPPMKQPMGMPTKQPMGSPGAINPYRNQKSVTPELLAQMARRRLGG